MERGAAPCLWWRKVDRRERLGLNSLTLRGEEHPVAHEISEGALIQMLQLASAATPEMAARRNSSLGPGLNGAVRQNDVARRSKWYVATARSYAITLGGNPRDFFSDAHTNRP